jgi:hypothetical protein
MITLFLHILHVLQPLDALCKPFKTTFKKKKKREAIVKNIYNELNKIIKVKWRDKTLD